ncbi:hypothetical protein [Haloplanus halobius]|uniref:hypothetical protein n=1 Tax=Haloplanus halobius TaxID=2934938 RepID=UPI00200BA5DD|nr:hypothetical protein [Haloplanus sp. XH21]
MWTAVLLCFLLVGSAATVVATAPAHVSVSGMSVSDDEPTVGETITVTPTIRHSGSGSGSFQVTEVTLVDASGTRYAEASDLGTLGAGDTIDVPLSATLQSAGERKLLVEVRGVQYDSDGKWNRVIYTRHPLYVSVSEPTTSTTKPQLNVDTAGLTARTESTVRVTASNGGDSELTDLSLRLSGSDGLENRTKLQPALAAQNSTTFEFDVRPSQAGTQQLNATLQYDGGRTVSTTKDIEVAPLRNDAAVYATLSEQNESTVLQYRVSNHGNTPLENVVVSGAATGTPLPTTVMSTVEPGASETATVELNERPSGAATVSATYQIGATTGQADQAIQFAAATSDENAPATPSDSQGMTAAQNRENWFGPLPFLTGGVVATGSILGYRSWQGR